MPATAIRWDRNMGFSLIGLAVVAAVFLPNLLLLPFPPRGERPVAPPAPLVFRILERVGQAACVAVPLFSAAAFDAARIDVWFVLMLICIAGYELLWVRYLVGGRTYALLFGPVGVVPMPMALLPVLAFGFAAAWSHSIWIGAAAVVLAVGHLVVSWRLRTRGARPV